jgi:hypothetical protein
MNYVDAEMVENLFIFKILLVKSDNVLETVSTLVEDFLCCPYMVCWLPAQCIHANVVKKGIWMSRIKDLCGASF